MSVCVATTVHRSPLKDLLRCAEWTSYYYYSFLSNLCATLTSMSKSPSLLIFNMNRHAYCNQTLLSAPDGPSPHGRSGPLPPRAPVWTE